MASRSTSLGSDLVKDSWCVLGKTTLICLIRGMTILCHLYVSHLNVKFSDEKF